MKAHTHTHMHTSVCVHPHTHTHTHTHTHMHHLPTYLPTSKKRKEETINTSELSLCWVPGFDNYKCIYQYFLEKNGKLFPKKGLRITIKQITKTLKETSSLSLKKATPFPKSISQEEY